METLSGLLGEFSPGENAIPVQRVSLAVVSIITGFTLWRKILDERELIESVERDMPEKLTTMLLEAAKLER